MGILPGFGKTAFHGLFDHCALQHDWTLVPEWGKRSSHTARDLESALALDTSLYWVGDGGRGEPKQVGRVTPCAPLCPHLSARTE